jgi:hypothetical protein
MLHSSSLRRASGPAASLLARSALVATVMIGLGLTGTKPVAAIGVNVVIVKTQIHDANHNPGTTVPVGTTIHPSFVVSGLGGTPTGWVDVYMWTNATCSGLHSMISGGPLTNGALDAFYLPERYVHPTTISYRGDYLGNATYPATQGTCTAVSFVPADPIVKLTMHDASHQVVTSVKVGTTVHGYVTVNGPAEIPWGTVQIRQWPNGTCTGFASLVGPYKLVAGQVDTPFAWPANSVGSISFRADYSGETEYNAGSSPCVTVNVDKYTPTFATELRDPVNHSVTTVPVGTTVHAYAALSGSFGTPTGVVTVRQFAGGSCAGTPTSEQNIGASPVMDPAGTSLSSATPSSLRWQLAYGGDANYAAATGPCLIVNWVAAPTPSPTVAPTPKPTAAPAAASTAVPTAGPIAAPTGEPQPEPSSAQASPSAEPVAASQPAASAPAPTNAPSATDDTAAPSAVAPGVSGVTPAAPATGGGLGPIWPLLLLVLVVLGVVIAAPFARRRRQESRMPA